MAGTAEGGRKAALKNKELYGEDFYRIQGAIGGRAKVPKGFALDKERARTAGSKGGKISRRGKVVK